MLEYLREFHMASILLRLGIALFFGGFVGMERERKRRPAGFRTYLLVCVGSALTMLLGQYYALMLDTQWGGAAVLQRDVSRFGAQVINGIGFLGAGTIIITGRQEVKGLTTAAALWACGCMGLAIGAGFYGCVALSLVLIFLATRILPPLENYLLRKSRNMILYVEYTDVDDFRTVAACLKDLGIRIVDIDLGTGRWHLQQNPSAVFTLRLPRKRTHAQVMAAVFALEHICKIDEI